MHSQSHGSTTCRTCGGAGHIPIGGRATACPICEGAGTLQLTPARIPIWYIIPAVVPASGTLVVQQQIRQEADFEWVFTASMQTSPSLFVSMTDGSTGRQITNPGTNQNPNAGVCPISLFAGTAQLPFPLLEPYIIARSSTVSFIFTDASAAQNTVYLALIGFSLFPQNAQQQGASGMIVDQNR
jgi:hypothetical protein